jgi:hypothetical protein
MVFADIFHRKIVSHNQMRTANDVELWKKTSQEGVPMKSTARIALAVAVTLIFASMVFPAPAGAASFSNYDKALDLKILGLLTSSPENFGLERVPSRVECAVMLVRLLGAEALVKQGSYTHPYTDVPAWADSYVGYLYQNGFKLGISDSKFGTNAPLSATEYITFLLRILGYTENTDFKPGQVLDKAVGTGILSAAEASALKSGRAFSRNDFVGVSYNALSARAKASGKSLLDKLVNTDKTISGPSAAILGLYTADVKKDYASIGAYKPQVTSSGSVAKSREELFYLIRDAMYHTTEALAIDIQGYKGNIAEEFEPAFNKAMKVVTEITGAEGFVSSWRYVSDSKTLTLTIRYRYSRSNFVRKQENHKAAIDKARTIVASLIRPEMSDYGKEKTLHDYIVNNTQYDYKNYLNNTIPEESYDIYGCLVLGQAVCDGYSNAMKLLCDLSSLESMVVSGKAKIRNAWENHSWNLVKVDGAFYHLDVTSDDPIVKGGGSILSYSYFNLPDREMALSSQWDKLKYPICTSTANSYYQKNRMVAESREAFDKAVLAALDSRRPIIELKVYDYSEARYSNIRDVIFKTNVVRKYNTIVNEEQGIIRIYNIQYS